jgi:hypothetical protein
MFGCRCQSQNQSQRAWQCQLGWVYPRVIGSPLTLLDDQMLELLPPWLVPDV